MELTLSSSVASNYFEWQHTTHNVLNEDSIDSEDKVTILNSVIDCRAELISLKTFEGPDSK